MSAISDKTQTHDSVVDTVRTYLGELETDDRVAAYIAEGRALAEIVAPLGLPEDIVAAVRVYPLFRGGILKNDSLKNNEFERSAKIFPRQVKKAI